MNSEYTVYTQPCRASFISANKIKFSIWWDIFISANKAPIDKMSVFGAIAQSKHGGIGNYPAPARSAKIWKDLVWSVLEIQLKIVMLHLIFLQQKSSYCRKRWHKLALCLRHIQTNLIKFCKEKKKYRYLYILDVIWSFGKAQ